MSARLRSTMGAGLVLLLLATACSGGGDDDDGTAAVSDTSDTSAAGGEEAPPPEQFTGSVEEFYEVPDPLPPGEPGDLIRIQPVSSDDLSTMVRVMYHSTDAEDRDRAVTGMITYPSAAAPAEGWPVVSYAHGTAGIAPKCAPSRTPEVPPAFGVEGVAVMTDYIGLGPIGELHPYLSKPAEGNAAIDAVRAAGNLAEANAGTRWFSVGHSQGGHAALSAAELSADYAPELELLGTAAMAPGSDFTKSYGPIDEIIVRVTGAMSLYGATSEHPDIDPDDYVGPELAAVADVIQEECLDAVTRAVAGLPADTFYENNPFETEPAASLMLENDVGMVTVDAPLLLIGGTADIVVNIERVRSLNERLCDIGQVTEFVVLEGADHGGDFVQSVPKVEAFLQARLAGEEPTDTC